MYDERNLNIAYTKDIQNITEAVIDLCADDRKVVTKFKSFLETVKGSFFSMYQFCLTHTPFMVDEHDQPFDEAKTGKKGTTSNILH
jgi:hypothetical protein